MSSMLDGIKDMIKRQSAYQEAVELLVEDATSRGIDEIILGQSYNTQQFYEADEMGYDGPEDPDLDGETESASEDEDGSEIADPKENDAQTDTPAGGDDAIPENDIGNEEIDAPLPNKPEEPEEPDGGADNIGNLSIDDPTPQGGDQPLPIPGSDGLPEPTDGDVPPTSDDNLVDVNLDLQSNTLRDVLPVPPAGAAQAVASDTMDQRVDAGFGGDSGDVGDEPIGSDLSPATPGPGAEPPTPVKEEGDEGGADDGIGELPVGESGDIDPVAMLREELKTAESAKKRLEAMAKSSPHTAPKLKPLIEDREKRIKELQKQIDEVSKDKSFSEAITLGGDGGGDGSGTEPVTANGAAPAEGDVPPPDEGAGDDENPVTSAVRDKVAESEDIDDGTDGIESGGATAGNEELMKTLSSLTKKIEDAKQLVMSKIST